MIIPPRYNGPPTSANGGYACGLLAGVLDGPAEVTLRRPPPLDVELDVAVTDEAVELRRGAEVIAQARPADVEVDVVAPVSLGEAAAASRRYAGFRHHAYPTCFTCGPARSDGLGVFAGPVEGRDGVVAAPWTPPADVRPEVVWAALDCPGGWAVDDFQREGVLLGRMAAKLVGPVEAARPYVVVGWRVGEERRKRYAASAVLTDAGEPVAVARSTWIVAERREP